MAEDPSLPTSSETAPSETPFSDEEIRGELRQILASTEFKSSKRCVDFLRFIVEQTLAGHSESLKERTVGIHVFNRAIDYDTNVEGVVRIKASEVRKRLALYYAGTGKEAAIRIEIPVGAYIPVFTRISTPRAGSPEGHEAIAPSHPVPQARPHPAHSIQWIVWPSALCVLLTGAFLLHWRFQNHSPIEEFWGPMISRPEPVLVTAAYAPVYLPPEQMPGEPDLNPLKVTDFTLLKDQFVGGGDLVAATRVVGLLERFHRHYTVRVGSGVTFEDLRDTPAILVGYSSTQWADITKEFKYSVEDLDLTMVRDNGQPTNWYPRVNRDYHTDVDYAVLTRAFPATTHAPVVLIAGCTQYGTEGAANLVTNPILLSEALKDAPKGWQKMNLQLVLEFKVIANSPASPKVLASHYW